MARNLDLGDGDFRALVREVEWTFRLKLERDEKDKLKTAADIQAILLRRFAGCSGRKCARTMAFFRLRGALKRRGLTKIELGADLRRLTGFKAQGWFDAFEDDCGMRLPRQRAWFLRWLIWPVVVACMAAAALAHFLSDSELLYGIATVMLIGAWIISNIDFFEFPRWSLDVLAFVAAEMNYGRLVEQGARARPDDIWGVLVSVLMMYSDLDEDEITPEARLKRP